MAVLHWRRQPRHHTSPLNFSTAPESAAVTAREYFYSCKHPFHPQPSCETCRPAAWTLAMDREPSKTHSRLTFDPSCPGSCFRGLDLGAPLLHNLASHGILQFWLQSICTDRCPAASISRNDSCRAFGTSLSLMLLHDLWTVLVAIAIPRSMLPSITATN